MREENGAGAASEENGAGQGAAATVAVGSRNPGQWETFGRGTWVLVGLGRLGLGSGQPCSIITWSCRGAEFNPTALLRTRCPGQTSIPKAAPAEWPSVPLEPVTPTASGVL